MSERYLDLAARIGARLCRDAIWWGRRCNWIGAYEENPGVILHESLSPDLYRGTAGVALLLFHLAAATGDRIFEDTARGALEHALSRSQGLGVHQRFGLYTGLAGLCHVLMRAAALTGNEDYAREAVKFGCMINDEVPESDVIGGLAGVITPLITLHRLYGSDQCLDRAISAGHRLMERATRSQDGWSWKTLANCDRDLACYGVGAAGVALSLLELYDATGEAEFHDAALEGFRYVRRFYDAEQGNWRDCRFPDKLTPEGKPAYVFSITWCHGLAGLALAQTRVWQLTADTQAAREAAEAIDTAARLMREKKKHLNFSLSHGLAGMAELLISATEAFGDDRLLPAAREVADFGIGEYEAKRASWPCVLSPGEESPDLMLGLAGIAYFYLRLYDSRSVPSAILLVPPPAAYAERNPEDVLRAQQDECFAAPEMRGLPMALK